MYKLTNKIGLYLTVAFLLVYSCKSDDGAAEPVIIQVSPDSAELDQDTEAIIDIFNNDSNIPDNATLALTNPTNGIVTKQNTSDNLLTTVLKYTPYSEFYGEDSFNYTVCKSGECETTSVLINVSPVTPVNYKPEEFPFSTLSEYQFFKGDLKDLDPGYGVLPYDLNSSLFSDYAKKKRFVWMPKNAQASYVSDHEELNFPIGAILIKNFYYENVLPDNSTKIIETRLMINTNQGWTFANYKWNEEQTEAEFTDNGSVVSLDWVDDNSNTRSVNYQIPPFSECFICHSSNGAPKSIGPKPQNLNKDYSYETGISNQLQKWKEFGYLSGTIPSNIVSTVDWKDESQSTDLRVRSYFDINCAHCHTDNSFCDYRSMRFAFKDTENPDNLGICMNAEAFIDDRFTIITNPGNAEKSALFHRINSNEIDIKMPLIGRTLIHEESVQLIEQWINSLDITCN